MKTDIYALVKPGYLIEEEDARLICVLDEDGKPFFVTQWGGVWNLDETKLTAIYGQPESPEDNFSFRTDTRRIIWKREEE